MICYNCNSEIPDNSQFCNNCGATFYNTNQPQPNFGFAQQPQNFGYTQPPQPTYNSQPAPSSPQKKTGIIMGIIIALLLIVLIVLIVLFVSKNNYKDDREDFIPEMEDMGEDLEEDFSDALFSYNGVYELTECSYMGQSFSIDAMEEMTGDTYDMSLTINGETVTLDNGDSSGDGQIEIDGTVVSIYDGDETLYGTYDEDEQTISIEMYGVEMIFEKTE